MLRSFLQDYSDAYILVKGAITVANTKAAEPVALILLKRKYLKIVCYLLTA